CLSLWPCRRSAWKLETSVEGVCDGLKDHNASGLGYIARLVWCQLLPEAQSHARCQRHATVQHRPQRRHLIARVCTYGLCICSH
ncbi:unnamed protein product, partial [Ectocarpus sp. 4 AP-2014]